MYFNQSVSPQIPARALLYASSCTCICIPPNGCSDAGEILSLLFVWFAFFFFSDLICACASFEGLTSRLLSSPAPMVHTLEAETTQDLLQDPH